MAKSVIRAIVLLCRPFCAVRLRGGGEVVGRIQWRGLAQHLHGSRYSILSPGTMTFSWMRMHARLHLGCSPIRPTGMLHPLPFLSVKNLIFVCALGMFAIRDERDYVVQDDFMKAVRKLADMKKLETKLDYQKV